MRHPAYRSPEFPFLDQGPPARPHHRPTGPDHGRNGRTRVAVAAGFRPLAIGALAVTLPVVALILMLGRPVAAQQPAEPTIPSNIDAPEIQAQEELRQERAADTPSVPNPATVETDPQALATRPGETPSPDAPAADPVPLPDVPEAAVEELRDQGIDLAAPGTDSPPTVPPRADSGPRLNDTTPPGQDPIRGPALTPGETARGTMPSGTTPGGATGGGTLPDAAAENTAPPTARPKREERAQQPAVTPRVAPTAPPSDRAQPNPLIRPGG